MSQAAVDRRGRRSRQVQNSNRQGQSLHGDDDGVVFGCSGHGEEEEEGGGRLGCYHHDQGEVVEFSERLGLGDHVACCGYLLVCSVGPFPRCSGRVNGR